MRAPRLHGAQSRNQAPRVPAQARVALPQALGVGPSAAPPAGGVGSCIPLYLVVEVIHWGSLLLVDAFDVSLRGTYHKAFTRGVMAPPVGVRAGGRLRLLCEEVVERL